MGYLSGVKGVSTNKQEGLKGPVFAIVFFTLVIVGGIVYSLERFSPQRENLLGGREINNRSHRYKITMKQSGGSFWRNYIILLIVLLIIIVGGAYLFLG